MSANTPRVVRRHYRSGGKVRDVEIAPGTGTSPLKGTLDGHAVDFDAKYLASVGDGAEIVIFLNGARKRAFVVRERDTVHVHVDGRHWKFDAVQPKRTGDGSATLDVEPFAPSPMTGILRKMLVKAGDTVASGATLFVVEAMKMEFTVAAPRDVVIDEVRCADGDRVDIQQVVVTFREGAAK